MPRGIGRTVRPEDFFPGPVREFDSSERLTPASMGGGTRDPDHNSDVAAAAFGRRSGDNGRVDQRASKALERAIEQAEPRLIRFSQSATAVAGTPTVLKIGGPKAGYTRVVRRINVGPLDYAAAAIAGFPSAITTIALIGNGSTVAGGGQGATPYPANSAQNVVSVTGAFPVEGTWGRDELTLEHGDELMIIVVGLAAAYVITAGGQGFDVATGVPMTYSI